MRELQKEIFVNKNALKREKLQLFENTRVK